MSGTNDLIADVLKQGPQPSSAVAKYLTTIGLSPAAARKAVERAREPVHKLSGISLPNRQRLLYHKEQYGSEAFWEQLFSVLTAVDSIYGIGLSGLQASGGSLPEEHFCRVSGAPKRLKGQIGYERVLASLKKVGLLESTIYDELGPVVHFARHTGLDVQPYLRLRARLVAESVLLSALSDWLRKNGFVSYGRVATRDHGNLPDCGSYAWDLTAPSYLRPLTSREKGEVAPGFVVADVLLGDEITELQAKYFIRKANSLASRRNMRPTLAILVATRFHPNALRAGKSDGFLFTTPDLLFGNEVGSALLELVAVLSNAGATAAVRPEVIGDLFSKLGKIEGAAGNLRGPLFEMVVGHSVREVEGTTIDIGVQVDSREGKAEIDVLRVKGQQEVWAYECKGYAPNSRVSLRIPDGFDQAFRSNPSTRSGRNRPPIPGESVHPFRVNPSTRSG